MDTSSLFVLTDIDFPDETKFMVRAVGKNGKSKRFTPILYDDIFAKYYNYSKYTPIVDYDNEYKNKSFIEYYNNGFDMSLSLNPIYIQGARTYKSDVIASFHNHTFKPGEYKSEADLEPFLSFDLINYLDMAYGSLRGDGDNVYARVKRVSSRMDISSGWYPVAFFVNGIQLDSGAINGLMVYDIEALAVVEGSAAEKFLSDYNDIEIQRTVVLLRTKLIKRGNSTNIVMSTPIGWQKPKKRYETKYETPASLREREPMRSTIYWNPSVKIKDGNARVSFYTSDNTYPYTVIIEGLTEYNEPIYLKDKIERVD